ncbi:MAG: hypothetical protein WBM44_07655, partial [Waterburya sp.]
EIGLQYSCPDYKSPMEDILSGRELKIAPIEYSAINHQLSTINQNHSPNISDRDQTIIFPIVFFDHRQ